MPQKLPRREHGYAFMAAEIQKVLVATDDRISLSGHSERFLSASGLDCGIANVNIGSSGAGVREPHNGQ